MPLPEIAVFESFLAGVQVVAEEPSAGHYEVIQATTTSARGPGATWCVEFTPGELQLDSVLAKISQTLEDAGSPSTRPVALATLGVIAATKGVHGHVDHANRLLRELRHANLLFNFLTMTPPVTADIRADYGPVRIEQFDPTKLEYWALRGHARWPVDPRDLRGHTALVGEVHDVTVLNTDRLPGADRLAKIRGAAPEGIVDCYYQAVADALLDQSMRAASARLSLVEAAGLAGLDLSSMTTWSLGVHLFTWANSSVGRAGCWAIFRQAGLQLNIPSADIWSNARQWLSSEFGLDGLPDREPIDHTAQTFARQMQDARSHLGQRRVNDAFLYFVIALDHLLGEEGRNVSTVTNRTAVLTHTMRAQSFVEEQASVRRIYDIRSRLVHSSVQVTEVDLRLADELARCVLWAITRVVAAGNLKTRDAWVEAIDKISHLYLGDPDVVTPDRLAAVGVMSAFRAGPPPPMLEYPDQLEI